MNNSYIVNIAQAIQKASPLVHNITNYVVMNTTANALLAIGASPVMAHAIEEVEEMASFAGALVLNMGTISADWKPSMILAGKTANKKNTPIVFDPVGMGATTYRSEIAKSILDECKPTIIRGNASEIMALAGLKIKTKGVDSTTSTDQAIVAAQQLAQSESAVIVISGLSDYVVDANHVVRIDGGSDMMPKVTGMGCTATSILGACAAAAHTAEDINLPSGWSPYLAAAVTGMVIMGAAAEWAEPLSEGPGSLQMHLLDGFYRISQDASLLTEKTHVTDLSNSTQSTNK